MAREVSASTFSLSDNSMVISSSDRVTKVIADTAMGSNKRVKKLQLKRARVIVFNTTVFPKAIYGVQVAGVPPTTLRTLRAKAASHNG